MKKLSLHIGVGRVLETAYTATYPKLIHAVNDARAYKKIAADNGFEARDILADDQATSEAVIDNITALAKAVGNEEALVFISYSGHGASVTDVNDDELDGYDEAFVLYDRLLIDDEIQNCLLRFPATARILFVTDSCMNGTVMHMVSENEGLEDKLKGRPVKGVSAEYARNDFNKHLSFYKSIKLRMTDRAACPIIHLGACTDNQLAYGGAEGSTNSLFTEKLLNVYDQKRSISYEKFHKQIVSLMPSYQTPTLDTLAGSDATAFLAKDFLT